MDTVKRKQLESYQRQNDLSRLDCEVFLETINNLLNENNLTFWICFGTLLGIYRDNNIMPWDIDLDIGLNYKDRNKVVKCLKDTNFELIRDIDNVLTYSYKKVPMDIYLFSNKDGDYICENAKSHKLPYKFTIPSDQIDNGFGQIIFNDIIYNTPKDIEKYLTRLYGDWRTPVVGKHAKV